MSNKREDYISWDEYFMGVAKLSGLRSKDPSTQVGACIVSEDNKILSMGYNGFPKGCSDDEFPWNREGDPLNSKYFYSTHSELNAILNYRGGSLEGLRLGAFSSRSVSGSKLVRGCSGLGLMSSTEISLMAEEPSVRISDIEISESRPRPRALRLGAFMLLPVF